MIPDSVICPVRRGVGPQGQSPQYRPLTCRSGRLLSSRVVYTRTGSGPYSTPPAHFAMTAVAVGSPRTKTKSSSSLPSSASTPSSSSAGFRFGDFDIEIDVETGAPADQAGSLGAISADSNRAYQRALFLRNRGQDATRLQTKRPCRSTSGVRRGAPLT